MSMGLNWWRAISIAGAITTGLFLIGFLKMFEIRFGESMFGLGITPEIALAILQIPILYAIYKKKL